MKRNAPGMQHKGTKMENVKGKLRDVEHRARRSHSCVIITGPGGKNRESEGMQCLQGKSGELSGKIS